MKKAVLPENALDVVQWHEARREGQMVGHEGLLIEHVKHPYHIDIDKQGGWQLWHFDGHDAQKIVAKGSANNVEAAKLEAVAAAFSKLPSLRKAFKQDVAPHAHDIPQNGHLTNLHRTLRTYLAGGTIVLWLGFGLYWFVRLRPKVATLVVVLLIASFWVTDVAIKYLEQANSRREKLLRQQQAKAMIATQQQKSGKSLAPMRRL